MAFPPPCPDPCPRSWAASPPSSVLGQIYSLRWGKSQVPREGERELQGQSEQRPHGGAGSGRLPAGGWPETPVWFEFPAPHSLHQPAAWLRAARSVPYLGLFSPPPPHQMALCGLKRQAWGAGGGGGEKGSCYCWLQSPSSCTPAPGSASPSLWLWGKPGPQSQTSQGGRSS